MCMQHMFPSPCSFLLDQLMRYEAVVLSGGEEETDYSSGEETVSHSTTVQEHAGETQVRPHYRSLCNTVVS